MMTAFSCYLLYIASYKIVYIVISFCLVYSKFSEFRADESFQALSKTELLVCVLNSEKIILAILMGLFIFSLVWSRYMKSWKNNTHIKGRMKDDSKIDESAFILPYVVTILTFNFNNYGWIICVLVYVAVGFIFVQSRKIQMSPIFILSRYHILTDGSNKVITRNTVEAFNLKLDTCQGGIEARELAKGVFVVFDK